MILQPRHDVPLCKALWFRRLSSSSVSLTGAKSLWSQLDMLKKSHFCILDHALGTWDLGLPAQIVSKLLPGSVLASSLVHVPVGILYIQCNLTRLQG